MRSGFTPSPGWDDSSSYKIVTKKGNVVGKSDEVLRLEKRIMDMNRYLSELQNEKDSKTNVIRRLAVEANEAKSLASAREIELNRMKEELEIARAQVASLLHTNEQASAVQPASSSPQNEVALKSNTISLSEIEVDFSCVVCMLDFEEGRLPNVWICGHICCSLCTSALSTCPHCRREKTIVVESCPDYMRAINLLKKKNE